MDDLVDRYLFAMNQATVGIHRDGRIISHSAVEDDCASSGELGLAGFAVDELEPCEAQARGFTHGHRKVYGIPEPMGPELLRQFQAFSAKKPDDTDGEASPPTLTKFLKQIGEALVRCASTLQYEAADLPAKQMRQKVPEDKFTERQQDLSRLDGGLEIASAKNIIP